MTYISKEPIHKGWSGDKKYCVADLDGTKYLLRIMPFEKAADREKLFYVLEKAESLSIPMCRLVETGQCEEGIYSLQTWIDGKDAEEVVPFLAKQEQYGLGMEAGSILKRLHSIPAPESLTDWEIRFNAKIDRNIKRFLECPIKFEGADRVIGYINENRGLLANRPQTFQHGDYHIGNMMIENSRIVIIDFDRYDFGDPWEEFNRIVWCAQKAPAFASGMVDGYFEKGVPGAFWKLLALYIGSNTLSSIPWAIPFGDREIRTMLEQAKEILSWFDGMENPIPNWYSGDVSQEGEKRYRYK